MAEKIRNIVEVTKFTKEENQPNRCLTLSIGIAAFPEDTAGEIELIDLADSRLYKAKQKGRNTLVYN